MQDAMIGAISAFERTKKPRADVRSSLNIRHATMQQVRAMMPKISLGRRQKLPMMFPRVTNKATKHEKKQMSE